MLTLVLWQHVVFLCESRTLFRMSLVMVVRAQHTTHNHNHAQHTTHKHNQGTTYDAKPKYENMTTMA